MRNYSIFDIVDGGQTRRRDHPPPRTSWEGCRRESMSRPRARRGARPCRTHQNLILSLRHREL